MRLHSNFSCRHLGKPGQGEEGNLVSLPTTKLPGSRRGSHFLPRARPGFQWQSPAISTTSLRQLDILRHNTCTGPFLFIFLLFPTALFTGTYPMFV